MNAAYYDGSRLQLNRWCEQLDAGLKAGRLTDAEHEYANTLVCGVMDDALDPIGVKALARLLKKAAA